MSEFNIGGRVQLKENAFSDGVTEYLNGATGTVRTLPEDAIAQSDWPYYLVELDNDEHNHSEPGLGRGVWLAPDELEALND